jgi:microcystin-dependent protein
MVSGIPGAIHQMVGNFVMGEKVMINQGDKTTVDSAYQALFNAVGKTFGGRWEYKPSSQDWLYSFTLPDLRGRLIVGKQKTVECRLGVIGGKATVQLTVAELPQHSHSGTTTEDGAHSHD